MEIVRHPTVQVHADPKSKSLIAIAASTVLATAFVGGSTDAVNGALSPDYFVQVMGWSGISDVWRASVVEGVLEGLLFGVAVALVFTATIGIITHATCYFSTAMRYLAAICAAAYGCWVAGGLIGMTLFAFSPASYARTFMRVLPGTFEGMLSYAWVGGSIWGVEFGGLLAVVIGLVIFRAAWRQNNMNPK